MLITSNSLGYLIRQLFNLQFKKMMKTLLLLILRLSMGLVEIPLQVIKHTTQHEKMLMSLKLMQTEFEKNRFLEFSNEKAITLRQQVLAQKKLSTYFGEVGVGIGVDDDSKKIQYFKMMFDTGSCEIWIPSKDCETQICKNHQSYSKKPNALQIQYLSGKVQGDMIYETITIGDLQVNNQVMGMANQIDIPLLDEVIWDGILGLAYPNSNLKRLGIKTLMENVIDQKSLTKMNELNQFAYYLGPDQGTITFGGADMKYKKNINDEFQWAPVVENNYWTINLINIRKITNNEQKNSHSRTKKLCPDGCKSIVDTGTYLVYGPNDKILELLAGVTLNSCAEKNSLPDIAFEFQGETENFELILTPEEYVLHFQSDGEDDCVIGIVPDNLDSGYTFGQVFLKAYYSLFDRENNRIGTFLKIGFVKSNQSPDLNEESDTKISDQSMKFKQKNTNIKSLPISSSQKYKKRK